VGNPPYPADVAAHADRGQIDDRVHAGGLGGPQALRSRRDLHVVTPSPDLVYLDFGVKEHDVLVHQGDAERLAGDRPGNRLDERHRLHSPRHPQARTAAPRSRRLSVPCNSPDTATLPIPRQRGLRTNGRARIIAVSSRRANILRYTITSNLVDYPLSGWHVWR